MGSFVRLEDGFAVYTCPDCGGSSHPATGGALGPGYVLCRACSLRFAKWVQQWTHGKGKRGKGHVAGVSFYEAAGRR